MLVIAVAFPVILGFLISIYAFNISGRIYKLLLACSIAPGIGVLLSSGLYFLWILYFRSLFPLWIYITLEILIIGLLLILVIKIYLLPTKKPIDLNLNLSRSKINNSGRYDNIIEVIGIIIFVLFFVKFINDLIATAYSKPNGDWDALAIWNLRARFLYSFDYWKNGFSQNLLWSHPDYPLQLPSFIARVWYFMGNRSMLIPALVSALFLLSIIGVIVFGVAWIRGRQAGTIAGIFTIIALTYSFTFFEYADMPLAFFILAANLMLFLFDSEVDNKNSKILILAGLFLGGAIWMKNEGEAFLLAFGLTELFRILVNRDAIKDSYNRWKYIFLGFLPILFVWILFKISLAPPNDIISNIDIRDKILNLSRYQIIIDNLLTKFESNWSFSIPFLPLIGFYLFIVGVINSKQELKAIFWIGLRLLFLGIIYFFIYVITPNPLEWHIATSMDRLIFHMIPSLILFVFLLSKNPFINRISVAEMDYSVK